MKKLIILLLGVLLFNVGRAQVNWKFYAKKISDKTYEVYLAATVAEPWHIYSQKSPKGGPLPTKIIFAKNPLLLFQGGVMEKGEREDYHDEIFDVDVYSFVNSVDFIQTIKLKANATTTISGVVEFMACTKQQCLTPQKIKFSVKLE